MPRSVSILGTVALDPRASVPLHRQLYLALREGVLDGRLKPGARLPATRVLAAELGVSRNTVLAAFEQLVAEGYLESRVGSGTRVAALAPEALLHVGRSARQETTRDGGSSLPLSRRGRALASVERPSPRGGAAFRPGLPARAEFPLELWSRLLARHARRSRADAFGYDHAGGLPVLRAQIAAYFGAARGVSCHADQVIVVAGAQAGLDLAARMLLDPGDAAWIEDPGYLGARGALVGAGARLVPVPIDGEGMDLDAAERASPPPRLVYVTPSHQFPTGVTMTLARRLALLERAQRWGAWILEDDYDSEYRYAGRPLACLQGLDRAGVVLYLGTFSKMMFPALRVGYVVVPPSLVEPFRIALRSTGHAVPLAVQGALGEFVGEGHLATHVRRMRVLYAERQARLLDWSRRLLAGALDVEPEDSGLQLAADLAEPLDDRHVAVAAAEEGVVAAPLSSYFLGEPTRRGLLLGYAGVPEREIGRGVERLARAIERVQRSAAKPARRSAGARR